MLLDTNTNQNIYHVFVDLTPLVQALFKSAFFDTFALYTPMGRGVVRRDPAHVAPQGKLCMLQRFVRSKYNFWPYFGGLYKTEMSVVIYMYLKLSPYY